MIEAIVEKTDFVRHVKEVLVWNDMHDALTHAQFESLLDSFVRCMKHAYEKGKIGVSAADYYEQLRPCGPKQGEDVWK